MNNIYKISILAIFIIISNLFINSVWSYENKQLKQFNYQWRAGNTNEIGYISKEKEHIISYTINDKCGIPGGSMKEFNEIIEYSIKHWSAPLGIKYKIINDNIDAATILFKVISRNEFKNIDFTDPANEKEYLDTDSIIGLVNRNDFRYVGVADVKYKQSYKSVRVYKIEKTTIYIIWDDVTDFRTDNFSIDTWKTLFSHEFGHSIGYRGHNDSDEGNPLMYENGSSVLKWNKTKPTDIDIEHLRNVYE